MDVDPANTKCRGRPESRRPASSATRCACWCNKYLSFLETLMACMRLWDRQSKDLTGTIWSLNLGLKIQNLKTSMMVCTSLSLNYVLHTDRITDIWYRARSHGNKEQKFPGNTNPWNLAWVAETQDQSWRTKLGNTKKLTKSGDSTSTSATSRNLLAMLESSTA